jgi:sulfoxide reductase catalytic subunit YedY
MLIRRKPELTCVDVTPKDFYFNRRKFLEGMGLAGVAALAGRNLLNLAFPSENVDAATKFTGLTKSPFSTTEKETSSQDATHYNNFYEFGVDKDQPAKNSQNFRTSPWAVSVEGEVKTKRKFSMDEILKLAPLEERIYRHRCVEGWSIVVPWIGFSLGDLLKRFEPSGNAAFVEFVTVLRPEEMPGQKGRFTSVLPWPYNEGLRLDEAMHPLAMIAVGLYGEELPNQNGAPLRLVVPWKYGFKSIKSIAKIRFVEKQPFTTWMKEEPLYYGFYSNVNPAQTRSSFRDQSNERRLGEFLMRKTLPFNGYADQVASLYAGMDLKKNY